MSKSVLPRLFAALLLSAVIAPAFALPVMEMRADDLLPLVADLKKALNLNPNQQTLWQQTESKTRALLRERLSRRERLQAAAKTGVEAANVELRDLGAAVDAEAATTAAEDKQMREWWLTVNDALTEPQRRQVAQLVGEQLLRVPDSGMRPAGEPRKDEGEHNRGGHKKGGMGGGMGGNGGSISLPGG
jgi:hypothetical protein